MSKDRVGGTTREVCRCQRSQCLCIWKKGKLEEDLSGAEKQRCDGGRRYASYR